MNSFLPAIGFRNIRSLHQLNHIYQEIQRSPDHRTVEKTTLQFSTVQLDKSYGDAGIGLSLIGEMDSDSEIFYEYSLPYIIPGNNIFTDVVEFEERISSLSYVGIIDMVNMTLIFTVQNVAYVNRLFWSDITSGEFYVSLSALSTTGQILIPFNYSAELNTVDQEERQNLIRSAKEGNDQAYEDLIIRELSIQRDVARRIPSEDVLSIVESSLVPYDTECDLYRMTGTILYVMETENYRTHEQIYVMDIECMNYTIRTAINKNDLEGEPIPGRRFRGEVWLQGTVRVKDS